uniref:Uncharacterized protein n=1 Tax=Timspurckia oligopyrenoides TaxID=708627 RepID=A0A7S0ZJ23_9RHOD|mmetsp:Transcript_6571/g.11745  ORF Transcript_6571/g.11745 Transcript_6571/m.11745 type:complete len:665 (+) Transcript_6571:31-2025(+)
MRVTLVRLMCEVESKLVHKNVEVLKKVETTVKTKEWRPGGRRRQRNAEVIDAQLAMLDEIRDTVPSGPDVNYASVQKWMKNVHNIVDINFLFCAHISGARILHAIAKARSNARDKQLQIAITNVIFPKSIVVQTLTKTKINSNPFELLSEKEHDDFYTVLSSGLERQMKYRATDTRMMPNIICSLSDLFPTQILLSSLTPTQLNATLKDKSKKSPENPLETEFQRWFRDRVDKEEPGFELVAKWCELVDFTHFNSQSLTVVALALSRLLYFPPPRVINAWRSRYKNISEEFTLKNLIKSCWALSKIDACRDIDIHSHLESAVLKNARERSELNDFDLKMLILSFIHARKMPSFDLISVWIDLTSKQKSMETHTLIASIWAVSELGIIPSSEFMKVWFLQASQKIHEMNQDGLTTCIKGVASIQSVIPDCSEAFQTFYYEWIRAVESLSKTFYPSNISGIAVSLRSLQTQCKLEPNLSLFKVLVESGTETSSQELVWALWGFEQVNSDIVKPHLDQWTKLMRIKNETLKGSTTSVMCIALESLNYHPGIEFFEYILEHTSSERRDTSVADLMDILKCLLHFDAYSDAIHRHWRPMFELFSLDFTSKEFQYLLELASSAASRKIDSIYPDTIPADDPIFKLESFLRTRAAIRADVSKFSDKITPRV